MKYSETVLLKNNKPCLLRGCEAADAQMVLDIFNLTHAQTDYLLTYPDENGFTVEQERDFLAGRAASADEIELCAIVDGRMVGTAGISAVGRREKLRHRAEFGIAIDKSCQGLGVGRALTRACIACAREAGYAQLELDVVADNAAAIALYESMGLTEYGRNPRGFRSRVTGWQPLILMRMELD